MPSTNLMEPTTRVAAAGDAAAGDLVGEFGDVLGDVEADAVGSGGRRSRGRSRW